MSRKLMPSPYMPRILPSNVSASTVSRFLTSSGSNVPLRSRLVSSTTGPLDVCTVLRVLPFRRLPSWRSSSSRCDSISPSKAASRKLFSNGANAPSLPYNDLPERNCSRAFFLISSRLNCSSFFCSITCVKVGDFSGFDTVHFTASIEIVTKTVDAIGKDKIGIRFSPFSTLGDLQPYDKSEVHRTYAYLSSELNKLGIAYIHISANPNIPEETHKAIRSAFSNTIIYCNGFTSETAEVMLQEGAADLVAFGRSFLANPDLEKRIETNAPLNIVNFNAL